MRLPAQPLHDQLHDRIPVKCNLHRREWCRCRHVWLHVPQSSAGSRNLAHRPCTRGLRCIGQTLWINPSKAHYLTGKDFVDFFDMNWEQAGVDKKRSLVLFDTHLPDFFNIIKAVSRGFSTFVVDDNYPTVDPVVPWVASRLRQSWVPG